MERLKDEFVGRGDVKGFRFKKVKENEYMYLYEVLGFDGDSNNVTPYYEVFDKKESRETTMIVDGVEVRFDAKELYPNSNAFGVWAWCCSSLCHANSIFEERTVYLESNLCDKMRNLQL